MSSMSSRVRATAGRRLRSLSRCQPERLPPTATGSPPSRHRPGSRRRSGRSSHRPHDRAQRIRTEAPSRGLGAGERFYRIACTIEESAPIKYAKAYLVVNNLELVANVIRTVPPLEPREDEEFREIEIYLTASVGEQEIRDAIDLDQIERITVSEVDFESYAAGPAMLDRIEERRPTGEPAYLRIEASKLDEMAEYVEEMKLHLKRHPAEERAGGPILFRAL